MDEANRLNDVLTREWPAAGRCLSPLARRSAFPRGIPWQTQAARDTEINATIGQVTDGAGGPLPLPAMAEAVPGLDAKMTFLYAAPDGHAQLRQRWNQRQIDLSGGSPAPLSLPLVVHGLTQAVSLVADAFSDPDTDVIVPDPCWENYHLLFELRPGANVISYPFLRDGRFNVDGLADALARTTRRKAVVAVNYPANPAGYTPTIAEAEAVRDVLLAHRGPMVALFDDAYQGLVYEDGLMTRSLYWDVAERCDRDRLFPIKADGATKELFFFGGRIAFLSTPLAGAPCDALMSKFKCLARSSVGVCSGPSQALVLAGLLDPNLDAALAERIGVLRARYRVLKDALATHRSDRLTPWPFNSGVFALIGVDRSINAEALRQRLIDEFSVGTIAIPSVNALRVAYCSVDERLLPELAARLQRAVA